MAFIPRICVQQQSLGVPYGAQGLVPSPNVSPLPSPRPGMVVPAGLGMRQSSMYGRPGMTPQKSFAANEILPWMWLGSYDDAMNIAELQRHGITHILNVADDCPVPQGQYNQAGLRALHICLEDCDDVTIAPFVAQASSFLQQVQFSGGKVLVHCRFGVSRSATIVIAYLMQHGADGMSSMSFNEAYNFTRSRRPRIDPNPGFMAQLQRMGSAYQQPFAQQQVFGGTPYAAASFNYSHAEPMIARSSSGSNLRSRSSSVSGFLPLV